MAGKLEPREVKSPEVVEDGEGSEGKGPLASRVERREPSSPCPSAARSHSVVSEFATPWTVALQTPSLRGFPGQTESSEKTKDLLEMVKKLQKEGSLEPQIEDLINRIHELQQAKEKSSEELGEAQALWEALRQDLDSLSGEKVHLEEVLSRKQEALRTLQLHCQRKAEEAQRNYVLAEHTEQISIQNSQVTESQGPRKLGLPMEEQLEDLIGRHKDLWEFHMLKRRLAWEIRALQSSQEQLLTEERQALARLEDVERRLLAPPEAPAARAVTGGLKAEPEKLGGEAPAQTQNTPEDRAGAGEAGLQLPSEGDLAPPTELVPMLHPAPPSFKLARE